ncbi:MAG TPA: hypothetical protein VMT15_13965 [Bryobacteraceae bacterium]|nr:hypothetical protein [Bryobacteraceae bacterium]
MWRSLAARFSSSLAARISSRIEPKILLAQGYQCCFQLRSLLTLNALEDAEFQIYSQWGEDGIIEWLIQRVPMASSFIEFGVEDYSEANTRFLLEHRNWRGLVIDESESNMAVVREHAISWRHELIAKAAFITAENINQLFLDAGFSGDVGILSVDVDGNDYWIWKAISAVRPALVICEYNAVLGDLCPVTIPYSAAFRRSDAHYSYLYFGASIAALSHLATEKGYTLLGSNTSGSNAFFLRDDLMPTIGNLIADKYARPSRIRESRDEQGRLSKVGGTKRTELIGHLPVFDLRDGKMRTINSLGELFSDRWVSR